MLGPQGGPPSSRDLKYIGGLLDGLPVVAGDRVRATLFGNRRADFLVKSTRPTGPVRDRRRHAAESSARPRRPAPAASGARSPTRTSAA